MLSEDYFGFNNSRPRNHVHKAIRRTQLSSERLSSHSKEDSRSQDIGIEQLKKKYAQINKKANPKEKTKHKKNRLSHQRMNFNQFKMQNLHYNDEGGYDPIWELRQRAQLRALETLDRNMNHTQKSKSTVTLKLNSNHSHLKSMMRNIIQDKNNFAENEKSQQKYKNRMKSQEPSRNSSYISNHSHRKLHRLNPNQIIPNAKLAEGSKSSLEKQSEMSCLMLGMNTLRKDVSIVKTKQLLYPHKMENGESLNINSAESQEKKEETSQISINSRPQDDEEERNQASDFSKNEQSQSVSIRNSNLVTSDYERIKMLERRALESRVRILKREEESMRNSSNTYINNPITENSSLLPDENSNSHGSGLSNMIYASSKLFDEKRMRGFEDKDMILRNSSQISKNPKSGTSFIKLQSVQNEGQHQQQHQQQQQMEEERDNERNPYDICEYYNNGVQLSPGPSKNLLTHNNSPKIYSNSRIIYNQSNVSMEMSQMTHFAQPNDGNAHPSSSFLNLAEEKSVTFSKKFDSNQVSPAIKTPTLEPLMPAIKETFNQSNSSFRDNDELASTAKFNLIESIKIWNDFESRKLAEHFQVNPSNSVSIEMALSKLDKHIQAVNWISDFVEETESFYQKQQRIQFQICSFLLYRKFYQERVKIIKCLIGEEPNCFKLTGKEMTDRELKELQKNKLCRDLEECNGKLEATLQSFYEDTKKNYYNNMLVTLEPIKKEQVSEIFNLLSEEIELLIPKIDEIEGFEGDSYDREHSYNAICWRSFRIMELVFLLSELEGRKVKELEESIEPDDFEHYCKQYYGMFKETVYYYH